MYLPTALMLFLMRAFGLSLSSSSHHRTRILPSPWLLAAPRTVTVDASFGASAAGRFDLPLRDPGAAAVALGSIKLNDNPDHTPMR